MRSVQIQASARRVALVLADDPPRNGRIGCGVGPDAAASAVAILAALSAAGYRVENAPADRAELIGRLLAGPSNARPWAEAEETLSFADYSVFFSALPRAVQKAVEARWGAAEADPFYRSGRVDCGRFAIPGFRAGNVAVLIQPARGCSFDPKAMCQDPAQVPPHSCFAVHAWLSCDFAADVVVHLGKGGALDHIGDTGIAARHDVGVPK